MFRAMRRFKQQLPEVECWQILERNSSGVLAVLGDDGYPYTIPLNHVVMDGKIYFHGARSGHRVDALNACDKVSFCIVDYEKNLPEQFATSFRSVVVFGRCRMIDDDAEKRRMIEALCGKFSIGESRESIERAIRNEWFPLNVFCLEIEHMSGKESLDLMRERSAK